MKKVLALVVAAAMGLSSAAFAADAVKHHSGTGCHPQHGCQDHPSQKTPQSRGKTGCRAESSGCQKTQKAEAKPAAAQKAQAAKKTQKSSS